MSLSEILRLVPTGDDLAAKDWPPSGDHPKREQSAARDDGLTDISPLSEIPQRLPLPLSIHTDANAPRRFDEPGRLVPDAAAALSGEQMTHARQAADMFRVAWYRVKQMWNQPRGPLSVARNGRAPSLGEQWEYAWGRLWVPPGHNRGFLERAGMLYHATIGLPGVALGQWIAGTCARPYRFLAQFLVAYIIATCLAWPFAGHATALWMIGGLLGFAVLLYVAIQAPAWIAEFRQSRPAQMTGRESEEDTQ